MRYSTAAQRFLIDKLCKHVLHGNRIARSRRVNSAEWRVILRGRSRCFTADAIQWTQSRDIRQAQTQILRPDTTSKETCGSVRLSRLTDRTLSHRTCACSISVVMACHVTGWWRSTVSGSARFPNEEAPPIEWFVLSFLYFGCLHPLPPLFLSSSSSSPSPSHPVCQKPQSHKTARLPLQFCHDQLRMPRDRTDWIPMANYHATNTTLMLTGTHSRSNDSSP
ncbi:hypothetical protein ASPBRDRAFT_632207 [Aspergillus brasiliensis CBS 101740]|uniref:Uncharacterized protein n=1 Tax=Aspergillus brasiliensis (strain CBS 101740 / IMI 381727 / IBT 21946) TaxID=767769 RepID=A0A1L9UGE0_ASPBC|nr:hypothetical protein ASPBRDRAFT_632207 [Aspergillus brasiliensis CBS 101740]